MPLCRIISPAWSFLLLLGPHLSSCLLILHPPLSSPPSRYAGTYLLRHQELEDEAAHAFFASRRREQGQQRRRQQAQMSAVQRRQQQRESLQAAAAAQAEEAVRPVAVRTGGAGHAVAEYELA